MECSEMVLRRVEQQVEMLEKSIMHLVPDAMEIGILIDPNGSHVSLVEFEIDKNGRADRTILRYLLSVNKKTGKSEWNEDLSEDLNRDLKAKGKLLERKVRKDA